MKYILPVVVAAGLVAYLADIVSRPRSAGQLWVALEHAWWAALLLTLPYVGARLFVWNDLLQEVRVCVPFRPLIASFAVGEMTKSIPGGIYIENYLLDRMAHLDKNRTVRSAVATTATLGLEALLALTVVFLVGVPGWPWLRAGPCSVSSRPGSTFSHSSGCSCARARDSNHISRLAPASSCRRGAVPGGQPEYAAASHPH